jgi:putative membrane protein
MFFQAVRGILFFVASIATTGEDRKPGAGSEPFDDVTFVAKAASGGIHEVELGKLAATRAMREDVKKFAQKMVEDHTKANEELKKAAQAAGLRVPEKMNDENQKEFDHFKDYKGADFDKQYLKHMLEDHEKDVAEFTQASKEAKNPQVKAFAAKTLPVIQEHLELVKKLVKE